MFHYELLCILPGTLTEEEMPIKVEEIKNCISQEKGEEIKHQDLGKSRLSYPMKQIRYGYFELFTFQTTPESIIVIQKKMPRIEGVLRLMVRRYNLSQRQKKEDMMTQMKRRSITDRSMQPATVNENAPSDVVAPLQQETRPAMPASEKVRETKPMVDMKNIDAELDKILDNTLEEV